MQSPALSHGGWGVAEVYEQDWGTVAPATGWVNWGAATAGRGAGDSDAMQEESNAPAGSVAFAHRRSGMARGHSGLESGGQTPVSANNPGALGEAMEGCDSQGFITATPSRKALAASLPSNAAHRRPEAATATAIKWEQLLRDHPYDPMVHIPSCWTSRVLPAQTRPKFLSQKRTHNTLAPTRCAPHG